MFFFSLTGNATIFLVVIMAYDRYVAISNPLRYRIIISDLACLKILLLALTVSFMVAVGQTVAIFSLPFCIATVSTMPPQKVLKNENENVL
ncbi:hypothetical protein NDU88_001587 [Pleurodeles waltl]|uniref:G-protein coupled receptors family 1 profile domain-containing protein n=1 Tax=Pleurodeles waltl TaxID=8319 RepID=A0AAV7LLY3_PLEWA|nr:hypothetical protein NDU88_001587 [Pleurodeles waltl]